MSFILSILIAYDLSIPLRKDQPKKAHTDSICLEFKTLTFLNYNAVWMTLCYLCHRTSEADSWNVAFPSAIFRIIDQNGFRSDGTSSRVESQYYGAISTFGVLFFYTVMFMMRYNFSKSLSDGKEASPIEVLEAFWDNKQKEQQKQQMVGQKQQQQLRVDSQQTFDETLAESSPSPSGNDRALRTQSKTSSILARPRYG